MSHLNLAIPERYRERLRVGTCSWKYDSWKGLIYRPDVDCSPNDYLPGYAQHFSTVEIDRWFWSLFPSGVKLPDDRHQAAAVRAFGCRCIRHAPPDYANAQGKSIRLSESPRTATEFTRNALCG